MTVSDLIIVSASAYVTNATSFHCASDSSNSTSSIATTNATNDLWKFPRIRRTIGGNKLRTLNPAVLYSRYTYSLQDDGCKQRQTVIIICLTWRKPALRELTLASYQEQLHPQFHPFFNERTAVSLKVIEVSGKSSEQFEQFSL